MATRRTQIINALISHLTTNTSILEDNISRNYHVLGEVNDFPALTMVPRSEVREHRGAGRKSPRLIFRYVHTLLTEMGQKL